MEKDKISELTDKSIKLLEQTKKQHELYIVERKLLYTYLVNKKDIKAWESFIEVFEELIDVENVKK